MHKVVTESGWEFNAQSLVKIGNTYYDMDEMTEEQREYIWARLEVQGLNAAYAGRIQFQAEGLLPICDLFPICVK